jgi:hypothetical protein
MRCARQLVAHQRRVVFAFQTIREQALAEKFASPAGDGKNVYTVSTQPFFSCFY